MNDLTLEERDLFEALSRYPHLVDENKAADILATLVNRLRGAQGASAFMNEQMRRVSEDAIYNYPNAGLNPISPFTVDTAKALHRNGRVRNTAISWNATDGNT